MVRRKIMRLSCCIQNYHWGRRGSTSKVALLAVGNTDGFEIEEATPYAELWMGTHPNGPSFIIESGEKLNDWISRNPEALGEVSLARFGQQLPFLFKILSVDQALSIQAHPSKKHAEELHASQPTVYKDPNHKPEMAIALTPFEALCGFRPIGEIKKFLEDVPELSLVIGEDVVADLLASDEANLQNALKNCFRGLVEAPQGRVAAGLEQLLQNLKTLDEPSRQSLHGELISRLHNQYPGDVGVFGPFFFNRILLKPGEAIFLDANEPHAYLSGDCVECMACSDNVVRAGLTPKPKDVDTLCSMLSYICEPASLKVFPSVAEDSFTEVFRPPVPDFAVAKITIPSDGRYLMIQRESASICILVRGEGTIGDARVKEGAVLFIPAGQRPHVVSNGGSEILIFQALVNV